MHVYWSHRIVHPLLPRRICVERVLDDSIVHFYDTEPLEYVSVMVMHLVAGVD